MTHVYTSVVALPYSHVLLIPTPVIISISPSANSRHILYVISEEIKHDWSTQLSEYQTSIREKHIFKGLYSSPSSVWFYTKELLNLLVWNCRLRISSSTTFFLWRPHSRVLVRRNFGSISFVAQIRWKKHKRLKQNACRGRRWGEVKSSTLAIRMEQCKENICVNVYWIYLVVLLIVSPAFFFMDDQHIVYAFMK